MHFVLAIDGANSHITEPQINRIKKEINPLWLIGLTTYAGHEPDA